MTRPRRFHWYAFAWFASLTIAIGGRWAIERPVLAPENVTATLRPAAAVSTSKVTNVAFADFRAARLALPLTEPTVSLAAVGDMMFSRTVGAKLKKVGYDQAFADLGGCLRAADMAFGNLETPLTPGREIRTGEMSFRSDPAVATSLAKAGIDAVSLANNHMPNFGAIGITDTLRYLREAGVGFSGAGENVAQAAAPAIVKVGGRSFAFLSYNDSDVVPDEYFAGEKRPGTNLQDVTQVRAAVSAAVADGATVIVSMHSGWEYKPTPNRRQTDFAAAAVAAGATAVIGHHPHVVQTVERSFGQSVLIEPDARPVPILYSLGNFIFDQAWSRETQDGLMAWLVLGPESVRRVEFTPVVIRDLSRPAPASGVDAQRILARLGVEPASRAAFVADDSGGYRQTSVASWSIDPAVAAPHRLNREQVGRVGESEAVFELNDGTLAVKRDGIVVWSSAADVWVDDFSLADLDGDGQSELAVRLWKAGQYGSSQPVWENEDEGVIRQRLFIYELDGDAPNLIWGSSALERPNCAAVWGDFNADGRSEMAVIEGDYAEATTCRGPVAVWRWNDWGFTNEWRSTTANWSDLTLSCVEGRVGFSVE